MNKKPNLLGIITAGSLTEGMTMRVSSETALESLKTGKFVSIAGIDYTFFHSLPTYNYKLLILILCYTHQQKKNRS